MKHDYLISMSYVRTAGSGIYGTGRVLEELDHKINRNDVKQIENEFAKKYQLSCASVVSIFELEPIPDIKNEPEEINPCML